MTWQSAFELSVGKVRTQPFLRHKRYRNVLSDERVELQFSLFSCDWDLGVFVAIRGPSAAVLIHIFK